MRKSDKSLAKELGTDHKAIARARKHADTDEEVVDIIQINQRIKSRNVDTVSRITNGNKSFKGKVRRIDQSNTSSLRDVLQDCKERYVKNEEIIQKLQYEADMQESFTIDNGNGSMSVIPALNSVERFVKLNIALRNQVVQLEQALEISAEDEEDPFS